LCENEQKPELERKPLKQRAPEPEPYSLKPTAAEAELCHFYDGTAALNNPLCNRAHRRSRVKILADKVLQQQPPTIITVKQNLQETNKS